MHLNTRGKRLWIVDETGQATPVKRPADIHQRPRGRHLPDWWVEEKAPDWRPEARGEVSLLRLGMTQNEDAAKRSARRWPGQEEDPGPGDESDDDLGPDPDMAPPAVPAGGPARGMKIGAGHKPQAYDALGRYTDPRGGSMPIGGGPVRLFGAEGLAGEPGGEAPDEPGEGLEATAEVVAEALEQAQEQAEEVAEETAKTLESAGELKGVLVADSGRVVSDAGGGAEKAPATITWKNDNGSPVPTHTGLEPHTKETAENLRKDNPQMNTLNVNSGKRIGEAGPHGEGRAVDINRINGVRVVNLPTATGPQGEQARESAANLEKWAKNKSEVTEIIGPTGWWKKDVDGKMQPKIPDNPKDIKTLEEHKNHYHIGTKW